MRVRNTLADLVVSTIPVCVTSVPVIIMNAIPSEENFTELRIKLAETRDARLQSSQIQNVSAMSELCKELIHFR